MPQVITNLDLKKNEIQNVVLQPLSTPPSNPKIGQKYFNTNDNNEYRWNGTAWVTYQAPLSTTTASTISIPNGIIKGDGSTLTAATAGTDYQAPLPSQTGNSGKYLTTNGSVLSWASPPGAPVTSVNTKTGDVVLTAADVGAATSSDISAAINALDGGTIGTGSTTKTITSLSQTNGNVSATFSNIAFPVTSVNTKTGAVSLTAADIGAATSSDISTAINALDGSITGTAGAGKTFTAFSQTNGKVTATFGDISITKSQISDFPTSMTPTSHASSGTTYGVGTDSNYGHLKLSDSTTSTSSTSGGIAATPAAVKAVKDAIPNVPSWALESTKPTYTASEVGAVATTAIGAASGVVPLNASSKIDSTYLPSYVDDVIEGYYNATDGKFYEEGTYTTEIIGEAGKIYVDLTSNLTYRWSGTEFVEISSGGSVVSVSRSLTSGTKIATLTIDGTGTDLYAPTDTDTKVEQTKVTPSSYTYWRGIPFGALSASSATTAFVSDSKIDREYTVDNLRFQPSEGTLRIFKMASGETAATGKAGTVDTVRGTVKAHSYYVDTSSSSTTNRMESDSSYNIYFRVNSGTDTVMTLYSNGTDMQVRPGGQYDDKVDLGKSTVRWKNLYLSRDINLSNTSAINFGSFGPNISSASQVQLDLTSYVEADDGQGGTTIVSHLVKITGVDTPVASDDAANKAYVDAKALPAITASDNGKVLTVNGTSASWETAQSGGSIATTTSVLKGDNSGGAIAATVGTDYLGPSSLVTWTDSTPTPTPGSDYRSVYLPPVTSADNGKILAVVNGEWTAVELPLATGVNF